MRTRLLALVLIVASVESVMGQVEPIERPRDDSRNGSSVDPPSSANGSVATDRVQPGPAGSGRPEDGSSPGESGVLVTPEVDITPTDSSTSLPLQSGRTGVSPRAHPSSLPAVVRGNTEVQPRIQESRAISAGQSASASETDSTAEAEPATSNGSPFMKIGFAVVFMLLAASGVVALYSLWKRSLDGVRSSVHELRDRHKIRIDECSSDILRLDYNVERLMQMQGIVDEDPKPEASETADALASEASWLALEEDDPAGSDESVDLVEDCLIRLHDDESLLLCQNVNQFLTSLSKVRHLVSSLYSQLAESDHAASNLEARTLALSLASFAMGPAQTESLERDERSPFECLHRWESAMADAVETRAFFGSSFGTLKDVTDAKAWKHRFRVAFIREIFQKHFTGHLVLLEEAQKIFYLAHVDQPSEVLQGHLPDLDNLSRRLIEESHRFFKVNVRHLPLFSLYDSRSQAKYIENNPPGALPFHYRGMQECMQPNVGTVLCILEYGFECGRKEIPKRKTKVVLFES